MGASGRGCAPLGARAVADLRLGGRTVVVIEGLDEDFGDGRAIETTQVDAVAIGVGARHVEGFHSTVATEQVLLVAGVEAVVAERVRAAQQTKARARHDPVPKPTHAADGAVALAHDQPCRCVYLEGHRSAVATAAVRAERLRHCCRPTRGRTAARDSDAVRESTRGCRRVPDGSPALRSPPTPWAPSAAPAP